MAQGLVHVIRHVAFEDLGNLDPILKNWGFEVLYFDAGYAPLPSLTETIKADILIILGGPISANDDHVYPFLLDEMTLIEKRLAAELPILGICLGAQLIARVLGTAIYAGASMETGWATLQLTESGKQHCLRYLSPDKTAVLHWHQDSFDLPKGATLLASTPRYAQQAFYYGSALALQFHPEITPNGFERWLIGHAHEIATLPNTSITALRQSTHEHSANLQTQAALFWQSWLSSML